MPTDNARRRRPEPRENEPINFQGVLCVDDLARLLKTSDDTIKRRLKEGTFPIPPLATTFDNRFRWSGPVVRRWLEDNGVRVQQGATTTASKPAKALPRRRRVQHV